MTSGSDQQRSDEKAKVEREIEDEIRKGRKYTLADAIGRLAGPGAMKGTSPVPRKEQSAIEIEDWLRRHVPGSGELQVVLLRDIRGSDQFLHNFEQPLAVLAAYCRHVLDSDYGLQELVRQSDVEWGRVTEERPIFEKEGQPPDPCDPYTLESVRKTLTGIIEQLAAGEA
jgi:hypothetical protein